MTFSQEFLAAYRHEFPVPPKSYVVFCSRSTGVDVAQDVLLEIALLRVQDGKPSNQMCSYINWALGGNLTREWMQERIDYAKKKAQERGYHASFPDIETVMTQGQPVHDVLAQMLVILSASAAAGEPLVSHGGAIFGFPVLGRHLRWHLEGVEPPAVHQYDTGMFEKAGAMNLPPWPNDTLQIFQERVGKKIGKGKWALRSHCAPEYKLFERAGLHVDTGENPMVDCYLVHQLYEIQRGIISGENQVS